MKKTISAFLFLSMFALSCGRGQPTLHDQLESLNVMEALVVPSQAIDEHPIWSEDARFLGVNIMGEWHKVDLNSLTLTEATWMGDKRLGIQSTPDPISPATAEEIDPWLRSTAWQPRELALSDGRTVSLRTYGFSTTLGITSPDGEFEEIWTSDLGNCHSIAVSPDETYFAYICELAGVVVRRVAA